MTSPLVPLASNDLFGGGPTSKVTRQRIQVAPTFKQPEKPAWLRGHVIQPGRSAERRELPNIQRPPSSRKLNHATSPTRNCFASRAGDYQAVKCFCPNEPPNVGVDAAGSNCVTDKLSMTSPLVPLASNELFDGGSTSKVTRQRSQIAPAFKQPRDQLGLVGTSFNLAAARSGVSCRTSNARRPTGN